MSDLINRKDLLEIIEQTKRVFATENQDYYTGYMCALSGLERIIAGFPTAYDVEQVVKELKEKSFPDIEEEYTCNGEPLLYLAETIDIVKCGGVNERD